MSVFTLEKIKICIKPITKSEHNYELHTKKKLSI